MGLGPDRRGSLKHGMRSALFELLLSVVAVPAAIFLMFDTDALNAVSISDRLGLTGGYVWAAILLVGGAAQIVGTLTGRYELARLVGTTGLAVAVLSYGMFVIPEHGGRAAWTGMLHLSVGVYLVARAGRYGGT